MGLQPVDEILDLGQMALDARLHQGGDGGGEEMDGGLLAAAHAGAVARDHRLIVGLVEQQGLQRADLVVQVLDADEVRVGGRQVEPHSPARLQLLDAVRGLGLVDQGAVAADLDALHAAFTGIGIDGDAEESAAANLLLLAVGPVGLGDGELIIRERLHQEPEFLLGDRLLLGLAAKGGQGLQHGLVHERAHVRRLAGAIDQLAQTLLDVAGLAAQILGRHAALDARDGGGEDIRDRVDQAGNGAVRADRETVAAGGAVLRHILRDRRSGSGSCRDRRRWRRASATGPCADRPGCRCRARWRRRRRSVPRSDARRSDRRRPRAGLSA